MADHTIPTPGTPLPWVAHSAFYPHGTVGDIFAKDAHQITDCTPICRVVRPQSKSAHNSAKPPIDELHAIVEIRNHAPIIEANAAYIVTACNLFPELFEYVASSAMNGCATAQALVAKAGA